MTTLLPTPTPDPAASVTPRLVPARVDGNEIAIPCPSWCTLDHIEDNPKNLVDTFHFGDFIDLEMPLADDGPALVALARLGTDAFSPDPERRKVFLYVEDGGGSRSGHQRRVEANAFADALEAFAGKIRSLTQIVEA